MHLDLHVFRFDWAGEPSEIGPGVADLARRAEDMGVRTLSFMDHYFQMDEFLPADDPMLEGYTALGFVAGCTERLAPPPARHRRHLPTPGRCSPRSSRRSTCSRAAGPSWASAPPGTSVSTSGWACRSRRWPSASSGWRRPSRSACRCGATTTARSTARTTSSPRRCAARGPSARRARAILIGGGGERKTLRFVAQYADACNFFGDADEVAHKLDVLRRHCDDVGRDPNEIEVTVLYRGLPPEPTADDVLRAAEAFAKVGVSTIVTGATGDDPAGWLESTYGPVMDRLAEIEPATR